MEATMVPKQKTLVLIDGEHYTPVVKNTIHHLMQKFDIIVGLLLGGTEKLSGTLDYSIPVYKANPVKIVDEMLVVAHQYHVTAIIDLSDAPILTEAHRFLLINHALAAGYSYYGSDFSFTAPPLIKLSIPTLAIYGTDKRIGKTAISNYTARWLTKIWPTKKIIILAMGRGGPIKPELINNPQLIDLQNLLARAQKGEHAASDFLEDAVLTKVPTIGCYRCGGGMTGLPFFSNVTEGAQLAQSLKPNLLLIEGSGSCIPSIKTDKIILLIPAKTLIENLLNGFGRYRILLADLIIITLAEEPFANPKHIQALKKTLTFIKPTALITAVTLRPKPIQDFCGKKIIYFTTAPEAIQSILISYLSKTYHCDVLATIGSLTNHNTLEKDLQMPKIKEANIFLIEIKAAGIHTVALFAQQQGIPVVFCDNEPTSLENKLNLEECLYETIKDF